VLAAGQGRRLASITGGVPKQYYAPQGGPTLLEDTIHRLAPIVSPARLTTVIDVSHEPYATELRRRTDLGQVVRQPADRGTAAGVLLGVSALGGSASDLVVLTPSDQGVADPVCFRRGLRRAFRAIRTGQADIVLFAVAPSSPVGDYGWVRPAPGAAGPGELRRVSAFVEKPRLAEARGLFADGAAWNTMVLAGRVGAMLDLYRQHLPELARIFAEARAIPINERASFLDAHYPSLPMADFSRDLLAHADGLQSYIWPETLGWTDLGTPERLDAWLVTRDRGPRTKECRGRARPRAGAAA
jgi:mannose-1-phosphate guanylyltransferase